jgi:hypothetical protein
MRTYNTIGTIVAAMAFALALGATNAHAGLVYYETNAATSAAAGTLASGGTGTGGGLCNIGATGCPSVGLGKTIGPLTGGLIQVTPTQNAGLADYQLTFSISGIGPQSFGSIWDITVVSGSMVQSLGTTNIVTSAVLGGGPVTAVIAGNGTFLIGITDLIEQYTLGASDTLPGVFGLTNYTAGVVPNTFSTFTMTMSDVYVPEPASITLLIGGIAALGGVRRRRTR